MSLDLLHSFLGGVLIGVAASLLLGGAGRTAGISGIAAGLLAPEPEGTRDWRLQFLAGLVAGGLLLRWWRPEAIAAPPASLGVLVLAGLLVGFGTRVGGGCTSGHGICGLARLSVRSLVAVVVFITLGMVTVAAVRLGGGA